MFNPLNPGYSSLLGPWPSDGYAPNPIYLCVCCRSKSLSRKERSSTSGPAFVCNECGTTLEQTGDQYRLTRAADTEGAVWRKYAGRALYSREWSNIANGGLSDEEIVISWNSVKPTTRTAYGTPDKRISNEERQLLQAVHQQYADLRQTFLSRLKDAANVSENVAELRETMLANFDALMEGFLCTIALADGAIQASEAEVINILLGNDKAHSFYNALMENYRNDNWDITLPFTTTIDIAVQLGGIEEGLDYNPGQDPVIKCIEALGQAVVGADGYPDPLELKALSEFTAIAHSKAAELVKRMQESVDASTDDTPPGQKNRDTEEAVSDPSEKSRSLTLEDCISELHSLVGLASVKAEVETLTNLARIFKLRKDRGLPVPDVSFHMIFTGNPGTGKTVVARILAQIYGSLGLLTKGHLVEVDRSGLVGNFIGQTSNKTKKVIEKAKGGVLFIDEAYSLIKEQSPNDYGPEAIEILLKAMEDDRDDQVVIAAGYPDLMEKLLSSNPGLRSRFPRVIAFPDYCPNELVDIFNREMARNGYVMDGSAQGAISNEMERRWKARDENYANARDVRNLFERVIGKQADRISRSKRITRKALTTISESDVRLACGTSNGSTPAHGSQKPRRPLPA